MPLTTTRKKRRHVEMGGSGDAAPNTSPPRRSSTSPFKKDKEAILEMCRAEKQELLLELKKCADLPQCFSTFTSDEMKALWSFLHSCVTRRLVAVFESGDTLSSADNELLAVSSAAHAAKATACLTLDIVPAEAAETLKILSNLLASKISETESDEDSIKNDICLACEAWAKNNLSESDAVSDNAVVYLLQRSLGSRGTKSDVKRLWSIHESILNFRISDSSADNLRSMLLGAARAPNFVKSPDGVRFITFLFSISPEFVEQLHSSIKEGLKPEDRHMAAGYGDIYFRAWRQSGGAFRERVEECCLQDLMYHGVLANRGVKGDIFSPIFTILDKFHSAKNDRQCQTMLCRLWTPILWRNLKVANPMVRASTAELFFSAFPIEDLESDLEDRDAEMERQFKAMLVLLTDQVPDVRVAAISGVCNTLAKFWLLVPSHVLNKLVSVMIRELAFDAASPRVRQAVIRGLQVVLKCPRSHIYLQKILPRVGKCIHDVNDSVRLAMVDLLVEIKGVKAIKYWDVCPLESLLAQLENDKQPARQKIVKLLMNSFFPQNIAEDTRVNRCIYLVKENRAASRKFYEVVEKQLDLHDSVKFFLAILVHIKRFVKNKLAAGNDGIDDSCAPVPSHESSSDKENSMIATHNNATNDSNHGQRKAKRRKLYNQYDNSEVNEPSTSQSNTLSDTTSATGTSIVPNAANDLDDPSVVSGLLDIVCIFWVYRSKDLSLSDNKDYKSLVEKKASKILILLFKYYKSTDVIGSVVYLCSLLPHSALSTIAGFCLSRIKSLTLPQAKEFEDPFQFDLTSIPPLSTYTDALCNWGRGDDLFEVISGWLKKDQKEILDVASNAADGVRQQPCPQKASKGVRFAPEPVAADAVEAKPRAALILTRYILRHRVNRPMTLKRNRQQLEELRDTLSGYVTVIEGALDKSTLSNEDAQKLIASWDAYIKLSVLLKNEDSEPTDVIAVVEDLMGWTESNVINRRTPSPIGHGIISHLLRLCSNMITMGLCDVNFVGHVVELCGQIISLGTTTFCIVSQMWTILSEVADWAAYKLTLDAKKGAADHSIIFQNAIPEMLGRLLSLLTNSQELGLFTESNLLSLRVPIMSMFDSYRTVAYTDSYYDLLELYLASLLATIARNFSQTKTIEVSIQGHSPVTAFLLRIVSQKASLVNGLLEEVLAILEEKKEMSSAADSATLLSLVATFANDPASKASKIGLKEICNLIEANLTSLRDEQTDRSNASTDGDEVLQHSVIVLRDVKVKLGMTV